MVVACEVGAGLTQDMRLHSVSKTAVWRTMDFRPPYDVEPLLVFFARRTLAGVEQLDGDTYARTLRLPDGPAAMRLKVAADHIEGTFWATGPDALAACILRARHLLDLDTDPAIVDRHLRAQPSFASSVGAHPGMRVPGHVDGFEVAVRAVVGQQISVPGARTLLGRLVAAYGDDIDATAAAPTLTRLFPTAERMAAADPADLPMPRSRARALVAIAEAVAADGLDLSLRADRAVARRQLLALPGVGPWTADYIALRALGEPDVFLPGDLGVRRGLDRLGIGADSAQILAACSPWRSYAMMHVWQALEDPIDRTHRGVQARPAQ